MNNCRVVLVRPEIPGNIGSTARVMRNFGARNLVLVDPVGDPHGQEARRLSTHGEEILDACRIVGDLGEAVGDCQMVAATSARMRGLIRKQIAHSPEEVLKRMADTMRQGPCALVFGPESSGLTTAEVSRCQALVHIPTDPTYSALNLAQAVAVCLYELHKAWLALGQPPAVELPVAPFADQERMFEQLRAALEAIHFLYDERADQLMHAIRHLIGRAAPTPEEVRILQGLARQIQWYVAHHSQGAER
jgi:tRNA/rRNA methyltransferase